MDLELVVEEGAIASKENLVRWGGRSESRRLKNRWDVDTAEDVPTSERPDSKQVWLVRVLAKWVNRNRHLRVRGRGSYLRRETGRLCPWSDREDQNKGAFGEGSSSRSRSERARRVRIRAIIGNHRMRRETVL